MLYIGTTCYIKGSEGRKIEPEAEYQVPFTFRNRERQQREAVLWKDKVQREVCTSERQMSPLF